MKSVIVDESGFFNSIDGPEETKAYLKTIEAYLDKLESDLTELLAGADEDVEAIAAYDPSQPRDKAGRWTRVAGSSDFAQAAAAGRVASEKPLGGGVCQATLVNYTDDGTGVWKDLLYLEVGHDGNSEVAAYRLNKLLGFDDDLIPETVYSDLDGGQAKGTSQQFIEGFQSYCNLAREMADERFFAQDDPMAFLDIREGVEQEILTKHRDRLTQIAFLDLIIYNKDRTIDNFGVGPDGKMYAIDHGHAMWRRLTDVSFSVRRFLLRNTFDKMYNKKGSVRLPAKMLKAWRKITRQQWDAVFDGIDISHNVNPDAAWDNLQALITWERINF